MEVKEFDEGSDEKKEEDDKKDFSKLFSLLRKLNLNQYNGILIGYQQVMNIWLYCVVLLKGF